MPQASSRVGLFGAGVALLSSTPLAWALGMGSISNSTVLGSPLNVTIPVFGAPDEKLPPECIRAEVLLGESPLPSSVVHARMEPARGEGLYRVRVSTETRIHEPVVTVSLNLGCDPPLTKQFVLLVDPPSLPVAPFTTAAASSVRSVTSDASTPLLPLTPSLPSRPRGEPVPSRSTAAKPGRHSAKPTAGPRLTLEAPSEPMASPVVASAEDVALAKQLALLTELEGVLKNVSAENKAVQENLAALQLKLRDAELALKQERERQREQPRVVWVLGGAVVLLSLILLVVVWRQRRNPPVPFYRRSAFGGDGPHTILPDPPVLDSIPSHLQPMDPALAGEGHASVFLESRSVPQTAPMPALAAGPTAPTAPTEPTASTAGVPPASQREVAVEELIDLEQQADFFIALGQEQAAIELLTNHMNGASSASPLPYLKLLDIYRRRDDRTAYEQTRLRFHRRFTARIPDWKGPQGAERALEDHSDVMRALEACWAVPVEAMKRLESFLFRKEGQGTTFDLPAYRDLLMLYAVARDLRAQGMQGVDLEL